MQPAETPDRSRREWLAVAVVTVIGLLLRLWPMGRLGLTHFDEGIYAMVASWIFQPKGLAAIDPMLISYAPPGYPILGGLAYAVLGRSDGAMIAVSQVAGTLTIPVVAWLGRRTFGAGAGFASSVFCAFSGPHIAFSRMALTDVSFLLAWLLAIGAGMRYLERPGMIRAIVLGLAVGIAQQFKYNGWLSGGIVIGSAIVGMLARPEDRRVGSILKTFGWGSVAVVVASMVVWPWYSFVEGHGGYSALLRHQRSYLGSFGDWWPHLLIQADEAESMSAGARLILIALTLCCLTPWIARSSGWVAFAKGTSWSGKILTAAVCGFAPWLFFDAPIWLGLMVTPWLMGWPRSSIRVVGTSGLAFALLTPFYHPYARLWLPLHAVNWLIMGWLVADGVVGLQAHRSGPGSGRSRAFSRWIFPLVALVASVQLSTGAVLGSGNPSGLLDPSDSLRRACSEVSAVLPDEVAGLRVLVRPPVTYYLSGRVGLYPMAGSDQLLRGGDPRLWALVDSAILRSEAGGPIRDLPARFANRWEVVAEFPTTLALPTLLDLDPGAARGESADRVATLWLLRPRRPGALP